MRSPRLVSGTHCMGGSRRLLIIMTLAVFFFFFFPLNRRQDWKKIIQFFGFIFLVDLHFKCRVLQCPLYFRGFSSSASTTRTMNDHQ
jgi:hypothetical protein